MTETHTSTNDAPLAALLPPPERIRGAIERCDERAALLRKMLRLRLQAQEVDGRGDEEAAQG